MKIYPHLKPALDFLVALLLVILLMPLLLLVSLLIRLDSPGPILFVQERPGLHGKIIKVWKFRTMRTEMERDGRRLGDLDRLTRVGRILRNLSLDELPQLMNILRFQMSFIGPRPLLVRYLPFYTPEEMRRHDVRPGISGWAQVNGRNAISWERKFELDLAYVDHLSFLFDLRIAWMTIQKVLGRADIKVVGEAECSEALDVERTASQGRVS